MPLSSEFLDLQDALLGRYSLERPLGRGGMGTVYLARDVRLDRPVAIKVLHPALAASPEARERFLREARTAAGLSHPHIVPIFAVETREPFVFLVMELIQGETLGARLRLRGSLPPDDAERMLREVAWALGYAHAHGVIHRDITLENILLERGTGRALLADFGLAGPDADDAGAPRFGTPGYLAPEIIRGGAADPRSDLYALGVVAWTALAGRAPFEAPTPGQLLAKHLLQPPPALGPVARGASRRLCAAIEQCLAKVAEHRPQDTGGLLGMLERAPEPVAIAEPLYRWFRRWEEIAPVYSVATPLLAMVTWAFAMSYYRRGTGMLMLAAIGSAAATLTLLPVLLHSLFEMTALRRLQARGFGIDDIRSALPFWTEQLQREQEREGLRPLASRVIFDLTLVGAVSTLIMMLIVDPFILSRDYISGGFLTWLSAMSGASPTIYLATMIGIGIGLVSPGYRLPAEGRLRRLAVTFWRSRLASRIARVAGTAQQREIAAGTLHRPTAMVLGLAIEDLWKAMPAALREDLGDVPTLAQTLQSGAGELREMIARLSESEGTLDPALPDTMALTQTRQALELRHRESVAMLERLRLQLLRLLATRQPTAELTQQLDAARLLEATLLREAAGHDEVRRLLGRALRHRKPTSATPLTPVPA